MTDSNEAVSKRILRLAAALALAQTAPMWLGGSSAGYAADMPAPSVRVQGNHLIDSSGNVLQLRGVNVSGLEFAPINGQPQPDGWGGQKPNLWPLPRGRPMRCAFR